MMKKIISAVAVVSLALVGAVSTAGMANAAPTATTLIMSGGNGVLSLGLLLLMEQQVRLEQSNLPLMERLLQVAKL